MVKKKIHEIENVVEYLLLAVIIASWIGIFYQLYTGNV